MKTLWINMNEIRIFLDILQNSNNEFKKCYESSSKWCSVTKKYAERREENITLQKLWSKATTPSIETEIHTRTHLLHCSLCLKPISLSATFKPWLQASPTLPISAPKSQFHRRPTTAFSSGSSWSPDQLQGPSSTWPCFQWTLSRPEYKPSADHLQSDKHSGRFWKWKVQPDSTVESEQWVSAQGLHTPYTSRYTNSAKRGFRLEIRTTH